MGEVTPLVSRTNAEWQPASANNNDNDVQQRRRMQQQQQHQQQHATHHHNGFYHNSPQSNDTNEDEEYDYEFVDHRHANNNNKGNSHHRPHRRLWQTVQQVWSHTLGMLPIVRGQVRARTADYCQDDPRRLSCSPLEQSSSHDGTEYYEDTYNDESWACSLGTREADGIWLNVHDRVGTIMSSIVWVLVLYSGITVGLLSQHNHLSPVVAKIYFTICSLALASHAKTTFTDPGAIPQSAVPVDVYTPAAHAMCSRCQSYKPPGTHHCRICDRCISGMDHHCPWMNNCVGTANMKHFILFLCYTWTACAFALLMFGWNYFFCSVDDCVFSPVLIQLVRVMTVLCVGTLIFTSSMLTNVTYGVMTGIGTIDRLKMKADNTWGLADEEAMEWKDIFGVGDYWTWVLPFFDPVFEDYDLAMGYSSPQRLLRERA